MAKLTRTELTAAEALKAFKSRPRVQTATPAKFPVLDADGKDTGRTREGFETEMVSCTEEHVLGAAKYGDGRTVIVTIDGKRHEARA